MKGRCGRRECVRQPGRWFRCGRRSAPTRARRPAMCRDAGAAHRPSRCPPMRRRRALPRSGVARGTRREVSSGRPAAVHAAMPPSSTATLSMTDPAREPPEPRSVCAVTLVVGDESGCRLRRRADRAGARMHADRAAGDGRCRRSMGLERSRSRCRNCAPGRCARRIRASPQCGLPSSERQSNNARSSRPSCEASVVASIKVVKGCMPHLTIRRTHDD